MKNSKDNYQKFEDYKEKKAIRLKHEKPVKGILFRKMIRPVMRAALFLQRKACGLSYEFLDGKLPPRNTKRPVVFAVSHIGKWDFEIINEAIKPHFHILAADFVAMHGTFSGFFMNAFGVIFVDVMDREDRKNSRSMMEAVLKQGDNMMIFPEAAWNFSENEIIYDIPFGCVDIALAADAAIIPICMEQYGKHFVINVGDEFYPTDRVNSTQELRDIMASLKYKIWEHKGIQKRSELSYDYWHNFLQERMAEWKSYDIHGQITNVFMPRAKKEYFETLRDMRKLNITEKNYFMVMDLKNYLKKYG